MKTKRIISLLLVVVMLFSVVSVSFASAAENSVNAVSDYVPDYDRETPVIIVHGMSQNDTYVLDENGNRIPDKNGYVTGWPLEIDVMALIKEIFPNLLTALITRQESGLPEKAKKGAYEALYAIHKDNKGNYLNTVDVPCYEYPMSEMTDELKEYYYNFLPIQELGELVGENNVYYFGYDSIGDVMHETEKLHHYIHDVVMKQTGSDKVNLCHISLGGTIAVNYLETYPEDYDLIKKMVFVEPAIDGSNIIGDILTDNLSVYDDKTLYEELLVFLLGDTYLSYFINILLRILPDAVLKETLRSIVEGVVEVAIRPTSIIWALCPDAYYEEARAKWLSDDEYAEIRDKADYFMDARANFKDNLFTLMEKGTKVYDLVCYDVPLFPLCKDYKTTNADRVIHAASTSMCATFADLGTTLPAGYKAAGTYCNNPDHNHISPDGVVDATTGLIPCTTWYIKGQAHELLPLNDVGLELAIRAMADENMVDVYSNPAYPQFNEGRLTGNTTEYIKAWEEADKSAMDAETVKKCEDAVAVVNTLLDETIVDSEKWLDAEENLRATLAEANVIEDTTPTGFEKFLTCFAKTANLTFNKFFETIGKGMN